jgi:hypothetical protein
LRRARKRCSTASIANRGGSALVPSNERHRRLPELAQIPDQPENCPVCEVAKMAVAANVSQVVVILGTRGGRESYRQHDGLCRPHVWLVL